jgi:hypothetical protein
MFIQQRAWADENNYSNSNLAEGGGKHGSPAKQYFTTSHSTDFSPIVKILSDDDRSDEISYLNIL